MGDQTGGHTDGSLMEDVDYTSTSFGDPNAKEIVVLRDVTIRQSSQHHHHDQLRSTTVRLNSSSVVHPDLPELPSHWAPHISAPHLAHFEDEQFSVRITQYSNLQSFRASPPRLNETQVSRCALS